MKLTIESSGSVTTVDGVPVRAWKGTTERGVECTVLVARIAVEAGKHGEFERELLETGEPVELRAIDLRHVL